MALIFAQQTIPQDAWLVVGTETACKLMLASANVLAYSSGSPDTLPALTAAAVLGGGTTFDRTADTYVAYTVQGSTTLSICKESAVSGLAGTYALLCRVLLHEIAPIQSTGSSGSGMTNPMTTEGDVIYEHSGVPARLAVGATGQVLSVVAGDPAWVTTPNATSVRQPTLTFTYGPVYGTGSASPATGDGGNISAAQFNEQGAIAVYGTALYICDGSFNSYVRKVDLTTNTIVAFAGQNFVSGATGDGGAATSATLGFPCDLSIDSSGNVSICDSSNCTIRTVVAGTISLVAGSNASGFSGDGGAATSAKMNSPAGVAVAPSGDVYIADQGNNRIRKVTAATGFISTICGTGTASNTGDGGAASAATINNPTALRLDPISASYLLVSCNGRIRKIDFGSGHISTLVTTSGVGLAVVGLCIDPAAANVYYIDANRIMRFNLTYQLLTYVAGDGTAATSDDTHGLLAITAPYFSTSPGSGGLAFGPDGTLFVSELGSSRIRRII